MSWEKFLRDINKEKGGVGLSAIEKARGMGASKAEINAFLERRGIAAGSAAQSKGYSAEKPKAEKSKKDTIGWGSFSQKDTGADSWEKFLREINKEKGGVGLNAIQKAQGMGASKADINAYLERKGFNVGAEAQKSGFGKPAQQQTPAPPSWEDFLKGINTQKGGVGLSAIQQAEGMGASKDQINQFLGAQGFTVGDEARKVGYGPALVTSGAGTQSGTTETSDTKYATDLDKYLAGIGTQAQSNELIEKLRQAGETERVKYEVDSRVPVVEAEAKGKIDLQKIVNSGYSNIARIERGSDMFRSIMGAFNF